MFSRLSLKLRRLGSKLWQFVKQNPRPRVVIKKFRKFNARARLRREAAAMKSRNELMEFDARRPIRIATFNAAMFSLAPATLIPQKVGVLCHDNKDHMKFMSPSEVGTWAEAVNLASYPKRMLKDSLMHHRVNTSPQHPSKKNLVSVMSKRKVSSNTLDNETSLECTENGTEESSSSNKMNVMDRRSNHPVRSPICFPAATMALWRNNLQDSVGGESILDVLSDVDADILALQDVKAEEEKGMKPLSDLAAALGMNYVFAESWAPEYGNAVLSKWPIKRWRVNKIVDEDDFRNVLKATIDVPWTGEIEFQCTQLDHLDEFWRMKQVDAIIRSTDRPHILAGGLNSLSASDYSSERWAVVTQYYEDMGKPAPKLQVMKFLKDKGYVDAGDSAGDCEPVVIIPKGQNMQGTSKYGTRVDYILASANSPYKFVPGSYSVVSSKGTSDHHIVQAEVVKQTQQNSHRKRAKNTNAMLMHSAHLRSPKGAFRSTTE